jgi:hypothetical protein
MLYFVGLRPILWVGGMHHMEVPVKTKEWNSLGLL